MTTATGASYAEMAAELAWLKANPDFDERPASLREFLGDKYLNIAGRIRPAILDALEHILGTEVDGYRMTRYQLAMITGGIGIGKTTVASIVLPYMAHWVLCLRDPQGFFGLLPGTRIAFMQMSTSEAQAKEVVFGDIKARIEHSPWFQANYPFDHKFKNQIRFSQKDIWIIPGDSAETTFEGYNILGGILDEADSHKITKDKDYAEQGFTTIHTRVSSRFGERGFLLVIGQMKRANGFAARKYAEFKKDPRAYAVRMAIWESFGWQRYLKPDGTRDSFWYNTERHEIVPAGIPELLGGDSDKFIEIPNLYRPDFMANPQKALRDLAGIPPLTGSPFVALSYRIEEARNRWITRYRGLETPVDTHGRIAPWFKAQNTLRRACHIDLAYSADGDALGFAMGHVAEVVEVDGELKPYIVIDMLMRIHAPAGREIFIGDIRRLIYELRDDRGFKIVKVTMDGFQSTDTLQQLERRRIATELVSVDKNLTPYHDLREAIYDQRIDFPKYMVRMRHDDANFTEIAYKELSELTDDGMKVDHPEDGSKDVADSIAGVVYTLMGDRTYRRRQMNLDKQPPTSQPPLTGVNDRFGVPSIAGLESLRAPLPPTGGSGAWQPPTRR